ncbi:autotransporter outer membrane beta-barrel domain-containing protein [Neomegalonema sp.]|uniref:autotransporter outer membrane beta-barrel domain-containing protein n=1 Tax=Neomegalonema sp. TaxID=2039713 RepID=UPI00261F39EB|nr:autotransporter outer membrane beta-barrel domain-containing protein [Neomegalonema sp.]MDD2868422.1 autotransporter outer membrane beta-barrel domain-containing protein [Neomegalonema sp.]
MFCAAAALLSGAPPASAQETNGFYANFHPNALPGNTLSLVVFGDVGATGSITNVDGFNLDFTIDDTGVFQTAIEVGDAQMAMDGSINGKSFLVTADKPISGIALNRFEASSDQTALLDLQSLGTEYYALGFTPLDARYPSQMSITAVQDGTEVTITSPVRLAGDRPAGTPFTITLNAGQSIAFNADEVGDISGTHILANRPVAVFGGAQCSQVPFGVPACDHLIEQNFPVSRFDTDYHLAVNFGGGADADLIRVLAASDDTEVFLDGVSQGVIDAGEFLQIDRVGNAHLTASKPVQVGQYIRGQDGSRTTGDPGFAIVPSVDQWLDSYTYATPTGSEAFSQNFLNVVISEADAATLALNGVDVDSSGFVLLNQFLYGNIAIDPGFGVISADNPFLAMIAGFNDFDSYFSAIATSFSGGASNPTPGDLRDITQADDVDGQLGVTLNPVFAGGTLNASVDQPGNFQIRSSGGAISVAQDVAVTYGGVISDFAGDSGALAKTGAGTLTLAGANTYTGGTLVSAGTLRLSDGASLMGGVVNNATFAADGSASVAGNFLNAGLLDLRDGAADDRLAIGGSYAAANGAVLRVDAALAGSGGTADRLVVGGDVGAGSTLVAATLSGTGGLTGWEAGQGIPVVEVGGATDAADFRLLGGPVQNNVFLYDLNLENDGVWYLQSSYLPTIPTYEAYPSALLSVSQPARLRDRVGDRTTADRAGSSTQSAPGLGFLDRTWDHPELWMRAEGAQVRRGLESSTSSASSDQTYARIQGGVDIPVGQVGGGALVAGVNLQYVNSSVDVSSPHGDGNIDIDSYGLGGTLTWYGPDGLYADGQAYYFGHRAELPGQGSRNGASSGGASLEVGKRIEVAPTWSVTPQAQISYTTADFDDFTGPYGERVSLRDGDSLRLRLGASLDREWTGANGGNALFVSANLLAEADRTTGVDVTTGANRYAFERRSPSTSGELGLGGQIAIAPSTYVGGAVYLEHGFDSGAKANLRGQALLNITW